MWCPPSLPSGFSSIVLSYARSLEICLVSTTPKLLLALTDKLGHYEETTGAAQLYHKLFLRETNCSIMERPCRRDNSRPQQMKLYKWIRSATLDMPGLGASIGVHEIHAHALRWLLRPAPWLSAHLETTAEIISYPRYQSYGTATAAADGGVGRYDTAVVMKESAIGIHIRRGDKVGREGGAFYPTSQYVAIALKLVRAAAAAARGGGASSPVVPSVVFLASDDPNFGDVVAEVTAAVAGAKLRVVSQGNDLLRDVGSRGMADYLDPRYSGKQKRQRIAVQSRATKEAWGQSEGAQAAIEIATDVLLLAECDYLIGTATSTVGNIAASLRLGRFKELGMEPPHKAIQLDPWNYTVLGTPDEERQQLWTAEVCF